MQWLNLKGIGYDNLVGFKLVITYEYYKRNAFDSCFHFEETLFCSVVGVFSLLLRAVTAAKAAKDWSLPRFWVSIRSYKKEPVKKNC